MKVSIRGCPRSGTHLAGWIVNEYFPGVEADESRRHRRWLETKDHRKMLVIVKHPVCWLDSLYRFVCIKHGGKKQIAVDNLMCQPADNFTNFYLENRSALSYWHYMNCHWLESDADYYVVNYETLLNYPTITVRSMGAQLFTKMIYEKSIVLPEHEMSPRTDKPVDLQDYKDRKWKDIYRLPVVGAEIEERLDPWLMTELGFTSDQT